MMIEGNIERRLKVSLTQVLENSLIPELNVYQQAYLQIDRPFIQAKKIHSKTKNEIGVEFDLTGDFKGKIFCFLDMFEKELAPKEVNFFKSLFIESMNILIGQTLTQIENHTDFLVTFNDPKFLDLTESKEIQVPKNKSSEELYSAGYKLISIFDEFDCRIVFHIY